MSPAPVGSTSFAIGAGTCTSSAPRRTRAPLAASVVQMTAPAPRSSTSSSPSASSSPSLGNKRSACRARGRMDANTPCVDASARMFGSTERRPPARLTRIAASMAVSARGEPRASEEPEMWSQSVSSGRRPKSAGRSPAAAASLTWKTKLLSPVDVYATKATAVVRSGWTKTPSMSTPSRSRRSRMSRPKGSSPTTAQSWVEIPSRAAALANIPGAPLGNGPIITAVSFSGESRVGLRNSASTSPTTRRDVTRTTLRGVDVSCLARKTRPPVSTHAEVTETRSASRLGT